MKFCRPKYEAAADKYGTMEAEEDDRGKTTASVKAPLNDKTSVILGDNGDINSGGGEEASLDEYSQIIRDIVNMEMDKEAGRDDAMMLQ